MPNPNYSDVAPKRGPGQSPKKTRGNAGSIKEKTANWPGLPGKSQPRDRSAGVKKLKVCAKSEGL